MARWLISRGPSDRFHHGVAVQRKTIRGQAAGEPAVAVERDCTGWRFDIAVDRGVAIQRQATAGDFEAQPFGMRGVPH